MWALGVKPEVGHQIWYVSCISHEKCESRGISHVFEMNESSRQMCFETQYGCEVSYIGVYISHVVVVQR